jgi:hypothetical protein
MSEETIENPIEAVQNNHSVQEATGEAQQPVETLVPASEEPPDAIAKREGSLPVKKGRPLLHKLEAVIEKGYKEFWNVGEALLSIKEQNLYTKRYSGEDYETFSDYLEGRWGYRSRGYQVMQAAKVRRLMIDGLGIKDPDSICPSERQYRERAGLLRIAEAGKLEELKDVLPDKKSLTIEVLDEKTQEVLPLHPSRKNAKETPERQKRTLAKKLAGVKKSFVKKVVRIRIDYPDFKAVVDEWLKGLLTPPEPGV